MIELQSIAENLPKTLTTIILATPIYG